MAGWRVFVAVELSRDIAAGVRMVQEGLKKSIGGVRWVRPEGIHLTLTFLGDVEPDRIADIASKIEESTRNIAPFTIGIGGCGGFPNTKNPRIIWIGVVDHSGFLKKVHAGIEEGLENIGFAKEERNFAPHLTLGRVQAGRGKETITQALEGSKERNVGIMEVREITLFRSHLKPTGAEYTKLKIIRLGKIPN